MAKTEKTVQGNGIVQPNLFIIGAMKSGTSSLHQYLGEHPSVFMCEPKEPGYFCPELANGKSLDSYLDLFRETGDVEFVGESSTHYTKYPFYSGVAERVSKFCPHAKLIYVMRDPVERTISHYWHMVRWHGERRSIADAISADPTYVEYSDYLLQLNEWWAVFPASNIWIDTFERLIGAPDKFCREIFEWLEVDSDFVPNSLSKTYNETPSAVTRREPNWLHRFRNSRFWERLGPVVPHLVRRTARLATQSHIDRNSPKVREELDVARRLLRERLTGSVQELRETLGRGFPEWKNFPSGESDL